jgi:hypothetical protein
MWQFLTGFGLGVYIGTFYDCRPAIRAVRIIVKENMPEEKNAQPPPSAEKPVTAKSIWPFS